MVEFVLGNSYYIHNISLIASFILFIYAMYRLLTMRSFVESRGVFALFLLTAIIVYVGFMTIRTAAAFYNGTEVVVTNIILELPEETFVIYELIFYVSLILGSLGYLISLAYSVFARQ